MGKKPDKTTVRTGSILETAIFLLLIFSPLAFGAVEFWAYTVMEITAALILIGFMLYRSSDHTPVPVGAAERQRIYPLIGAAVFLIAGVIIQLLPLPLPLIRTISPRTYKFWLLTDCDPASAWRYLSCYPKSTFSELLKVIAYFGMAAVVYFYRPPRKTKLKFVSNLFIVIISVGFMISLVGILQYFSSPSTIFGLRRVNSKVVFGPYVNRNHFAGFIQMVIPLAISALVYLLRKNNESKSGWKTTLLEFDPRILLMGFVGAVMIGALMLSFSRGGIITFFLSMIYFLFLARILRLLNKKVIVGGSILLALFLVMCVCYFDFDPLLAKLETLRSPDPATLRRLVIWKDSSRIFRDFPVMGIGLGGFSRIYPFYRTARQRYFYTHPENDYVQLAVEMGVWGLVSLLFFIFFYFHLFFYRIREKTRRRPRYGMRKRKYFSLPGRCLILGSSTAVVGMLLHSLTNFNLHIPANALLFFVLAAVSIASFPINTGNSEKISSRASNRSG